MKDKNLKDSRLIDALSYIDPKYIAEVADSLKFTNANAVVPISKHTKWRQIAALAACVLVLGAMIPLLTYVIRNLADIASGLPENTTEETVPLTDPNDSTEETTATPPDTTEEETTAEETTAEETTVEETIAPPETTNEETTAEETTAEETTTAETTAEETTAEETTEPETTECKHSLFTATEDAPTCTESATVIYSCTSCGHTWSEVFPALGHNFVNNICTRCGVEIEYDGSRGLEYEISSDGKYAILVGIGTCTDKDIVIASTYNGIPVARIDSYSLYNCQFIESVTIPEGVTIIHNEAFYLCKNLKKITLPSTLEQIQDMAFMECTKLEQITIPDGVREIGQNAFNGCINLSSLTLGKGVELIEENAFKSCTSLDYVNFPKSLRLLANDAFAGCTALTNIHYAGTIQEWNSVDSTGRDYGNTHVWYDGVPAAKINCTNGSIFLAPIAESEDYEAARKFLGIDKGQIGGIYEFVTKEKDQAHLDCYRVAYCEWKSDVGYMGQYEVLCEVYVNQYTGECEKVVYNYSDIPEVFLGVIFNREKFIFVDRYSNNETKECYLKTLELLPTCLFGAESQGYALLDIDGDSVPELIFSNSTLSSRGLILRYYDGKIYGYPWGGDDILSDGTNSRHEGAGDVRVLDELYFDGLYLKSRELLRYDSSNPNNVKYYVEGKVTTKAEYDKFAAKYNGAYPRYTSLDLYPVYVNPFPGG